MGIFFSFTDKLNTNIDAFITGISIMALNYIVTKYSIKASKEAGFPHAIYLSIIYAVLVAIAAYLFWGFPIRCLVQFFEKSELAQFIRWGEILVTGNLYFSKRKYGQKNRAYNLLMPILRCYSSAGIINRWVGMFLFSIPMFGIYYHIAYHMALELMPAIQSHPIKATKK